MFKLDIEAIQAYLGENLLSCTYSFGNRDTSQKWPTDNESNVENLFFGHQPNCLWSQKESTTLEGMLYLVFKN